MTWTEPDIVDKLRASMDDGATVERVGSTEEHLVVVVSHGDGTTHYHLDRDATRRVVATGLIDELAARADTGRSSHPRSRRVRA